MNMNVLVDGVVPRVVASPRRCSNGSIIAARCCCGVRASGSARSSTGSKFSAGMIDRLPQSRRGHRHHPRGGRAERACEARFALTDVRPNTILDTRLRALRRLEEMALKNEFDELDPGEGEIDSLLGDEPQQWKAITWQIRD